MTAKKDNATIHKIKSTTFARSMSLLNFTLTSGARFANHKWGELFSGKDKQQERWESFLGQQAQHFVEELGKLKGSIMKAGQMLSVYGEHFLPAEVNAILKTLQSDSSPVAWSEMEEVLRRQLPPEKLALLEIDPEPIAAASMGQVYLATIKSTKQRCALKVQYPGVDQAIDSDLKALRSLLSISQLVPKGPSFDSIFKEIRMVLHYEADYSRELAMITSYHELLQDDPRFIVPQVYPEFSSKRVLCMSFEEGLTVDSPQVQALSQLRRNKLAAAFMELTFREVFSWRLVQTDPHFGNYKIRLADGQDASDRIILFDFGAVRKFPKRYIRPFAALVRGALDEDAEAICVAGENLGFLRPSDSSLVRQLFARLCLTAIEGFLPPFASPSRDGSQEGASPYCWGETDLIARMTPLAKNAVFAFKLRTPPREAVFLDRKLVGTYFLVSALKLRMGPRKLISQYVDQALEEDHGDKSS